MLECREEEWCGSTILYPIMLYHTINYSTIWGNGISYCALYTMNITLIHMIMYLMYNIMFSYHVLCTICYSVLYATLLSCNFNIMYILVRAVSLDQHKRLPWATVGPLHRQHLVTFRSRYSNSQCRSGRVDMSEVESRTKPDWYEVRKRKEHRCIQTHIDKQISFLTESDWQTKVEERGKISIREAA